MSYTIYCATHIYKREALPLKSYPQLLFYNKNPCCVIAGINLFSDKFAFGRVIHFFFYVQSSNPYPISWLELGRTLQPYGEDTAVVALNHRIPKECACDAAYGHRHFEHRDFEFGRRRVLNKILYGQRRH
jgi:hypothetical protein